MTLVDREWRERWWNRVPAWPCVIGLTIFFGQELVDLVSIVVPRQLWDSSFLEMYHVRSPDRGFLWLQGSPYHGHVLGKRLDQHCILRHHQGKYSRRNSVLRRRLKQLREPQDWREYRWKWLSSDKMDAVQLLIKLMTSRALFSKAKNVYFEI